MSSKSKPEGCSQQLDKLKRFLTTIHRLSDSDNGKDDKKLANSVRASLTKLVEGSLSVEEFYKNFSHNEDLPLRPFVIPFLKSTLPLLRSEIMNSRSPSRALESLLFTNSTGKESKKDDFSFYKNSKGYEDVPGSGGHCSNSRPKGSLIEPPLSSKSLSRGSDALFYSKAETGQFSGVNSYVNAAASSVVGTSRKRKIPNLKSHSDMESIASTHAEKKYPTLLKAFPAPMNSTCGSGYTPRQIFPLFCNEPPARESGCLDTKLFTAEIKNAEELCAVLMSTTEKLRHALSMLEHRTKLSFLLNSKTVDNHWNSEVKAQADEAIQNVKRQAMDELQKAVMAAEHKANQMVILQRRQLEQMLHHTQKLLLVQEDKVENCWNCGRIAYQTCSTCQEARYCGTFCQHKDWQKHRQSCGASKGREKFMEHDKIPEISVDIPPTFVVGMDPRRQKIEGITIPRADYQSADEHTRKRTMPLRIPRPMSS